MIVYIFSKSFTVAVVSFVIPGDVPGVKVTSNDNLGVAVKFG